MADVLPPEAVLAVEQCLASGQDVACALDWGGRPVQAHVALLGKPNDPRGCVLLLEAVPA